MRRILAILLFFSGSLVFGQKSVNGTFQGEVYESDTLGFSYRLPAGYKPNFDIPNNLPSGTQYLFIADAHTGKSVFNRILAAADDADSYHVSLQDYARKLTKSLAVQPQTVLVHDAEPVWIVGKRFFRADLNEHWDGGIAYKTALWTERRNHFLFWMIVVQSPEELDQALHSLDAIVFRDDDRDASAIPRKTISVLPGKRVRVPESESKALLTKKGDLGYFAQGSGPTNVVVRVIVGPDGVIRDTTVLSGNPRLTAAALRAAEGYHFRPYVWQDHLVEMETEITIDFNPPKSK